MKTLLLITAALAFTVKADELAPELAPLATRHKTETAALQAQRVAAVGQAQQPYLAALDTTEKTATSAGQLPLVAAVTKERDAVKSSNINPNFPADLPKSLQPARKTYLAAAAKVAADFAPRQQRINADYLRALATIQPKAAANPELAKQIADEKARLLQGADEAAPTLSKGALERKLPKTVWIATQDNLFSEYHFDSPGELHYVKKGGGQGRFAYQIADDGTVHYDNGPDYPVTIKFTSDFSAFKAHGITYKRK